MSGTSTQPHGALFEFAPDALLVVARDGRIVEVNRRAAELFGGTLSDLVGSPVAAILPSTAYQDPELRFHEQDGPATARRGVPSSARRVDGAEIRVELSWGPVPGCDEVIVAAGDVDARARDDTRTQAILDFAPDAIVIVGADGIITFASRQVANVFGWPPTELVGHCIDELVPDRHRSGHDKLRGQFFETPRVREMGAGTELHGRRRDGTEFPVEISLSPLPGEPREVVAAVRDVSARRAVEHRWKAMLEFAPDATIIVDRTGDIIDANRQTAALFGHTPEQLRTMSVEMLLPERHRWSHVVHRDSFFASPRVREMGAGNELFGLRADGSEFAVEISLSPLPGNDPEVMATIRDVSERRAARDAIEAALDHEREAARELRATTRLKDEFLDIAAHELRTPLASIVGFASALIDRWDHQDDTFKRDLAARILRNGSEMAELTERLLDVSRLQAGRVEVTPVDIDLPTMLHELVADLRPLQDREVLFDLDAAGTVRTDPTALSHVVSNLLTNAAKYSSAPAPIRLSAGPSAGGLEVTVADAGVGIPAADLPHLFEHFYRGENHSHGRGAGVGLSVAQQYVELLDGHIRVQSTPGEGSVFTVWLPDTTDTTTAADEDDT